MDKSTSVLLIDRHPVVTRIVTRFLQKHAGVAAVTTATNGEEALQQAEALQPQVTILDLDIPGSTGVDIVSRLRKALPGRVIIILTLLDTETYRQAALAAGADGFVSKASLTTDLLPAIRQELHKIPAAESEPDPSSVVDV